ncbi:MAG: phosphodiesterase YaeI [Bryobacterales bacterium]|nr:phosphodiesterase YaeI [Bryobacterales bacterium]
MKGSAAGAAVAMAGIGYGLFVEPRWPETVRLQIPTRWLKGNARLRILQLSDLHASPSVPLDWLDEVFRMAMDEQPDVICLTGDYVTSGSPVDLESYQKVLEKLSEAAPTFASMGNHDGGKWGRDTGRRESSAAIRLMLGKAGIQVCHNANVEMEVAGARLQVVGLGDRWAKEFFIQDAFQGLTRNADRLRVVMSHNPDTKDVLHYHSWELLLCGHTHGGQVAIPGFGPPIVPVLDHEYVKGLHEYQGRRLYVTRGVGGVFGGLRINCRPEITVLDMVAGESPVELTDSKPRRA